MQRNYASHVQLTKVHEGGEPAEFKALFSVWEREKLPGQVKPVGSRIGKYHIIPYLRIFCHQGAVLIMVT